uniref:MICAL-like 1a n=1 Tax=Anabas testudineus TaxID=64144 RepID=A0A7N6AZI5_ANATE
MMGSLKALQEWCRIQCEHYNDVEIKDMAASFRDGLAFCAIIHRYRPDLIDFSSLSKENVYENNRLAFEVAEAELGIPALLDPEDMVSMKVPDRLSIITYVSQYYNFFNNKSQGKYTLSQSAQTGVAAFAAIKRNTLSSTCAACQKHVHLVQRFLVDSKLYHRNCFRCTECHSTLLPGSYKLESDSGLLVCKHHLTRHALASQNGRQDLSKKPVADQSASTGCSTIPHTLPSGMDQAETPSLVSQTNDNLSTGTHKPKDPPWLALVQSESKKKKAPPPPPAGLATPPNTGSLSSLKGEGSRPSTPPPPSNPFDDDDDEDNEVEEQEGSEGGTIPSTAVATHPWYSITSAADTTGTNNQPCGASSSQSGSPESVKRKKRPAPPAPQRPAGNQGQLQFPPWSLHYINEDQHLDIYLDLVSDLFRNGTTMALNLYFILYSLYFILIQVGSLFSFQRICKENPFNRKASPSPAKSINKPPKGPRPARPPAPGHGFPLIKRKVQSDQYIPVEDIHGEMSQLEKQLDELEQRGVELEKKLRDNPNDEDEERLLVDWFTLIHEKHLLVRREAELVYTAKQQNLEERQADVEYELRCLLNKPEKDWTEEDKSREQELMADLVTIIEQRNQIVNSMDQDRQREEEEDKLMEAMLKKKDFHKDPDSDQQKKKGAKFKPIKVLKRLSHKGEPGKSHSPHKEKS